MSGRSVAAATLGLLSLLAVAWADDNGPVRPAPRVQVTTPATGSTRLTDTIVAEDGTSLSLETDRHLEGPTLPRRAPGGPKVIRSRSERARRALKGALAGALIGGIVGYASGEDCPNGKLLCFSRRETAAAGAILLGSAGAAIGIFASTGGRWNPASTGGLPISAAPVSVRDRGVGLSVAFAFK